MVLGVTLWATTREQDRDLAMMDLTCRVAEGIAGGEKVTLSRGYRDRFRERLEGRVNARKPTTA